MLEPDWLIGQYKREAGNEAGTFTLVAEQKLSRRTPNIPTRLQRFQCSVVVGEHEIFTFELRYSYRKAD